MMNRKQRRAKASRLKKDLNKMQLHMEAKNRQDLINATHLLMAKGVEILQKQFNFTEAQAEEWSRQTATAARKEISKINNGQTPKGRT